MKYQITTFLVIALICFNAVFVFASPSSSGNTSSKENSDKRKIPSWIERLHGKVTYKLEDGESINKQHPDSFWIPTKKQRESLKKGDLVKLIFTFTDGTKSQSERMWVIVSSKIQTGYSGTLDNDPYCTSNIRAGLELKFQAKNVIDIYGIEIPKDKIPNKKNEVDQ